MRYIALFIGLLVLAACESSSESSAPGRITKERAIAIAMEANRQYPFFSKVPRAKWRGQGRIADDRYYPAGTDREGGVGLWSRFQLREPGHSAPGRCVYSCLCFGPLPSFRDQFSAPLMSRTQPKQYR